MRISKKVCWLIIFFICYYVLDILTYKVGVNGERLENPLTKFMMGGIACLLVLYNFKYCSVYFHRFRFIYVFILMFYMYIPFSPMEFSVASIYALKSTFSYWLIPLVYLSLCENEQKTTKYITILFFVMMVYGVHMHIMSYSESRFGTTESEAGFIFSLIMCFPLLYTEKKWSLYSFAFCAMMCVISGQRTAIIIAGFYGLWAYGQYKNNLRWYHYLLVIIGLVVLIPTLESAYENVMLRNQMDQDKGSIGSGREIFWELIWSDFWSQNVFHYFFGNGLLSMFEVTSTKYGMMLASHNGWLDTLHQFGIIGICLFVNVFRRFLKMARDKRFNRKDARILYLMVAAWFLKSIPSHGYLDVQTIMFSLCLSILVYKYYNQIYDYR